MCGLAAILSPAGYDGFGAVRAMTRLIRHRGPDDEGFAFFSPHEAPSVFAGDDTPELVLTQPGNMFPRSRLKGDVSPKTTLALGHRRLSIVDVSPAGHQPMADATGRYWIVYNGEIYNHLELRQELEGLGYRFVSRTDTEVILNAYAEWGEDCQTRFNGMWAFLLYDTQTGELFGSRDRFGVKPLFYTQIDERWVFASEIKQFTAVDGFTAKVHWQRAYEYLAWGLTDHAAESLFRGVLQVPPGGCFRISTRKPFDALPIRTWYQVPQRARRVNAEDAAVELHDLLCDSVRLRLRADVPVGSCLSGGLDSSSIVCLIHQLLAGMPAAANQQVVSSCSTVAKFDERTYIDEVVRQTGVRVNYVYPAYETVFEALPDLVWTQDAPFVSLSIFAQWNVFAEAKRQGLTVMLDGQGADEQLGGYHEFFGAWFAELLIRFRWMALVQEWSATRRRHAYSTAHAMKLLVRHAPLPTAVKMLIRQRFGGQPPLIRGFLKDAAFERQSVSVTEAARQAYQEAASVREKSRVQLASTNLPALLRYEDRNSMAHAVESRVPFLDYRIVEHAVSLPGEHKLSRGETKAVLRRAMAGVLPPTVANRNDKMGFATPESVVFTTSLADAFRTTLQTSCRQFGDLFDADQATSAFDQVLRGERQYESSIWRAVCFAAWVKRFGVGL